MKRLEKLLVLKIQLQIGLIDVNQILRWVDEQLLICDENTIDFEVLALASSSSTSNEMIDVLNDYNCDFNKSMELELINNLLSKAKDDDRGFVKVAHCIELIQVFYINVFIDSDAYFKCTIEDIEAGVYGNAELLHAELIEYLEGKLIEIKKIPAR